MATVEAVMEERIARLESDVEHIQGDIGEIKVDKMYTGLSGRIDNLGTTLDGKISALDQKMDHKVSELDDKLCTRISSLEEKMGGRFVAVDERFVGLEEKMDGRFIAVDERFTSIEEKMDDRFATVREEADARFSVLNGKCDSLNDRIASIQLWALLRYGALAATLLGTMARGFDWL